MNYTPNHHLPQWAASDRIRMEDFNQMNQNIENGLTAAASKAEAAFSPDNLPYVIGSYTGDGKNQTIGLPFKPSMVIISGITDSTDASNTDNIHYLAVSCNNINIRRRVQIISSGFVVYPAGSYDRQTPNLNEDGRHYDYIAFR